MSWGWIFARYDESGFDAAALQVNRHTDLICIQFGIRFNISLRQSQIQVLDEQGNLVRGPGVFCRQKRWRLPRLRIRTFCGYRDKSQRTRAFSQCALRCLRNARHGIAVCFTGKDKDNIMGTSINRTFS